MQGFASSKEPWTVFVICHRCVRLQAF
jgi:hypothetical protein